MQTLAEMLVRRAYAVSASMDYCGYLRKKYTAFRFIQDMFSFCVLPHVELCGAVHSVNRALYTLTLFHIYIDWLIQWFFCQTGIVGLCILRCLLVTWLRFWTLHRKFWDCILDWCCVTLFICCNINKAWMLLLCHSWLIGVNMVVKRWFNLRKPAELVYVTLPLGQLWAQFC